MTTERMGLGFMTTDFERTNETSGLQIPYQSEPAD
jgi:hypothetical protein